MFCILKSSKFVNQRINNTRINNTARYFPTYCTCATRVSDMRMYRIAWQNCCSFPKRLSFFYSAFTYGNYLELALKFGLLYLDPQPPPGFVPVMQLLFLWFNSCHSEKKSH